MKVCVAMSGGVDSSVVAGLLVEQGHEVVGVHMKLHDAPSTGTPGRCCGFDDALDARMVAARLDIPFFVMDLREAFRRAVMDDLADNYLAGRTPNPCVMCNGVLKFQVLLQRSRALGCSHLATGHYARLSPDGRLRMATDADKDQSYFLFPMSEAARQATLFPLGGLTKPQVREEARRLGLLTAEKAESQEICFIPDDDHTRFVRQHRAPEGGGGEIVDPQGKVLGLHDGYWRFTIGQRRGLGVAAGQPVYVLGIDPQTGRVTVGGAESLHHQRIAVRAMQWHRRPQPDEPLVARIRHRGALIPCAGVEAGPDEVRVQLAEPARAAAPGQALVLYAADEVVGGGWIHSVED